MKLSTLNSKLNLLAIGTNSKTTKSDKEYPNSLTAIMYLAPNNISGYEVCEHASQGCRSSCLYTAGMGKFSNVQLARIKKTKLFFEDQAAFLELLNFDLKLIEKFCKENSLEGYVRLNGTSDIPFFKYIDMESYSLYFYDYTKDLNRLFDKLPSNYKLTFSRDEESSEEEINKALEVSNVAIVYNTVPSVHTISNKEVAVIEGDLTDMRYKDPKGVIIGLKAKGNAKKDTTGFVLHIPTIQIN